MTRQLGSSDTRWTWLTHEQVLKTIEKNRPSVGKFILQEHLMGGVSAGFAPSAHHELRSPC